MSRSNPNNCEAAAHVFKMEFYAAVAENSQSSERKCPFPRAFAVADPRDAYGKAIAQQWSNCKMWEALWQKKRF